VARSESDNVARICAVDILCRRLRTKSAITAAICTANLLRYGVQMKPAKPTETGHLVDRRVPSNHDFAIAGEVTLTETASGGRIWFTQ
jgi:hypothetical protein